MDDLKAIQIRAAVEYLDARRRKAPAKVIYDFKRTYNYLSKVFR